MNLELFSLNFSGSYDVVTVESGEKALEVLKVNNDIKIVISDMKMPGMDGLQFIREAKDIYPGIVYYILTGFSITQEINSALESHLIKKYFSKPFNIIEIDDELKD